MAKSSYQIPFDSITGDLIEWISPEEFSGEKPIPLGWYDTVNKIFVYEPYKPWIRSFELPQAYEERLAKWEEEELKPFQALCDSGAYVQKRIYNLIPNYVFQDTLRYKGYSRGRSSAKILFTSESTGSSYGMFMTDFDDLMEQQGMNALNGCGVAGLFTFVKRGQNFGFKLADENIP